MTQSQILLLHLRDAATWVPSHELEKVRTNYGYLGTAALRRARELAAEGKLETRKDRFVFYRSAPKQESLL